MEIVTGDRYLDMLARFVEDNVAALLDGTTVLKLNPLGLHYLQARLDALQELEQLRTAAPVDYLRAYVVDLGDHRALELLRRVLRLLGVVKVVSVLPAPARDPTPITLLPFGRLQWLELRGCDLSTSAARGLLLLRPHLEKLICHNSTDALRHVFAERMVELQNSQVWSRLASVSCACNGILVMDESLQLLPAVEVLDLKRNRLTHVSNLRKCPKLKFLDLGFNCIQSVSMLDQVASSLTTLILRFNALTTTRGIDKLYLLESLDLCHNIISNFVELERLGNLRFLTSLNLEGNPVTFAPGYVEKTFSAFPDPAKLSLDGRQMSRIENWKVQKLIMQKCKQDGGFGLYTPAVKPLASHNESSTEENPDELVHKERKKGSRVAIIEDEHREQTHLVQGENHDSFIDTEMSSTNPVEAVEARLQELMKRLEMLKKDKSTLWFTEIGRLFEGDAGTSTEQSSHALGRTVSRQKSRRRKRREWGISDSAGSSSIQTPESLLPDSQENQSENIVSFQLLENLMDKPVSHSSPASPPHFDNEVLQRRQNLEEELLQLRFDAADFTSTDSDSSTSVYGADSDVDSGLVDAMLLKNASHVDTSEMDANSLSDAGNMASTSADAASNPLLVEEDSCFSNPMWVGSVLSCTQDKDASSENYALIKTNELSGDVSVANGRRGTSGMQNMKQSRQAWRVVPLQYDDDPRACDSNGDRLSQEQ